MGSLRIRLHALPGELISYLCCRYPYRGGLPSLLAFQPLRHSPPFKRIHTAPVALPAASGYRSPMAQIALISDVHANFEALKEVLADIDSHSPDVLVCLGDLVGYGPQPQECCDLLRERDMTMVQGNHEQGLINIYHLNDFNQPAKDALRRTREMIDDATYEWLISHPKSAVLEDCRFVHGVPPDSAKGYLWKYEDRINELFARFDEPVCFVGHTHDLMRFTWDRGGIRQATAARGRHPAGLGKKTYSQYRRGRTAPRR